MRNDLNMRQFFSDVCRSEKKKALPILSFPAIHLLGVSVKDLIADSDLQAAGMRLVAERTDALASVSFMDLSVEAECFGATVRVTDNEVPTVIGRLIETEEDAEALAVPAVGSARSGIYLDAIRKAKVQITDRPVLAGMIGPFSLAARLMDVSEIMMTCYDDPDVVHLVLGKVTAFLIDYARAYREAGANGIVMAEPVAGMLSPSLEEEFSSPYVKQIVDAVQNDDFAVVYHNCGDNTARMVDSILSTGAMAYHFGNSIDLEDMLRRIPEDTVVMGNLDPAGLLRLGTPERITEETQALIARCRKYPHFLVSSGCDIPPATPWENLDAFFAAVEEAYGR